MIVGVGVLAWQLLLPGFIGMADNGDFAKVAGPSCLASGDPAPSARLYFQPEYLRGERFCYSSHLPFSEIALVRLASSLERQLGDSERFDIRWLGALHALIFLAFYYAVLRMLRRLRWPARLFLSLAALWIFADVGQLAYFNSYYSDTAAILGALGALVTGVALMGRKAVSPVLTAAFTASALFFVLSKAQHGIYGVLPAGLALIAARRALDARSRLFAYACSAVLMAATAYIASATPEWYRAQARFNLIFMKLAGHSSPAAVRDLRELGLEAEDMRYAGMNSYTPPSPMLDPAWRERFYQRTSYGRVLAFYARHPEKAAEILWSDLRVEAWQRRSVGLTNFTKDRGFPVGTLAGRFSSWGYLRTRLFLWWPLHIVAWFAVVLAGVVLTLRRDPDPFCRALAWMAAALTAIAVAEFGFASLADALETSRHLLMFHALTDCTVFLALVYAATRLESRMRASRWITAAGGIGFAVFAAAVFGFDGFPPPAVPSSAQSASWIDNSSPRVNYSGRWQNGEFRGAFRDTIAFSAEAGATVRFEFEGTEFEYIYTKAYNRGMALVTIDGITRGTLDLFEPWTRWQANTVFGGLKPGRHTVEIRVLGRRNERSAGDTVDIDALGYSHRP
jgi:hypothetical protein